MFAPFMVNAWLSGSIVAVIAAAVGFLVVARGATFAAHAIPNGAFAGAAGAAVLGWNPLVGLVPFALLSAGTIGLASRRSRPDVPTALTLVALLALGATFLSLGSVYEPAIIALLFGEILGVSTGELLPLAVLGAASLAALAYLHRPLWFATASPELAAPRGVRVGALDAAFLGLVGVATALTVPVVGALLAFSLMVGPPAAAQRLVATPGRALAAAVGLSLAVVWASIAGAYASNLPVGFFVGTLSAAVFVAASVAARVLTRSGAA
ncbi:MAG TPA: metal ABC transporter permease [Acidimicrobiales bacterium]|nr:metal ABC transporter permease [Acidimicrobiales bacterium]